MDIFNILCTPILSLGMVFSLHSLGIVSTNTIPRDSIGQYYPLGQGCTRKYQSLSGRRECPVQCASVYFVPKSLYNASAAGHRLCYTLYRMSILQLISEWGEVGARQVSFGFFRGMSNYVLELLHRLDCHTNCPTRLNILRLSSFDIFFELFILNT